MFQRKKMSNSFVLIFLEKDVFRYFLHTQQGDDVKGISGLVFYEKIFCLGLFGL